MCGVADFVANCKCDLSKRVSDWAFQIAFFIDCVGARRSYILQHFDFGADAFDFGIVL
jgi:hypothetical protein